MNIIIVSGINPVSPKPGGTRTYVMNLIDSILSYGENVTLIGISHSQTPVKHRFAFTPILKKETVSSYRLLFNLFLKAPFLKVSSTSVIHAQRPDLLLPFVFFFRQNPKVCTLHGLAHKGIFLKKGKFVGTIYHLIERYTLKHTDAVIAVSDETKDVYLQKYPWLENKIEVIPVGFDDKLFRPLDKNKMRRKYGFNIDDKIILYVGRFEKEKRLDILLNVFKEIKTEIINAKLVLVGDGREKHNIENLIKKLDIKDVVILNTIEHDRMPEIMNCADVFALTSMYEGMPTVVLEALACGVPVVSTDVGDVHKVVKNSETGYLVETDEEIKRRLSQILRDSNSNREICVNTAKNYSWSKISKKIISLYSNLNRW